MRPSRLSAATFFGLLVVHFSLDGITPCRAADTQPVPSLAGLTVTPDRAVAALDLIGPDFIEFGPNSPDAYPAGTIFRHEYRAASGPEVWAAAYWSYETPAPFARAIWLTPSTDYLIRVRAYDGTSPLGDWSEPLLVRTRIAAPYILPLPYSLGLAPGAVVNAQIGVRGEELVTRMDNLPFGLHYHPATCRITGIFFPIPEYVYNYPLFTATNPSGSSSMSFVFYNKPVTPASSATYQGVMQREAGRLGGAWRITRSGKSFTGSYRGPAGDVAFSGRLADDSYRPAEFGHYSQTRRNGSQRMTISVLWNKTRERVQVSVGDNEQGADTSPFTGYSSPWNARVNSLPDAGVYTALLIPETAEGFLLSPRPYGIGFFRLTIQADGRADLVGETATGARFTHSSRVSATRIIPVYQSAGAHRQHAELRLDPISPGQPFVSGDWRWTASTKASSAYPYGIREDLLVVGSPLPAVGGTRPPLDPLANEQNVAELRLTGGGLDRLAQPPTLTLGTAAAGFAIPAPGSGVSPLKWNVRLDSKTGLVTGSVTLPDPAGVKPPRLVSMRGLLLKDPLEDGRDQIGGHLLFPDAKGLPQSSRFEITEPAPID